MRYGQSLCLEREVRSIAVDFDGARHEFDLVFEPYQSLMLSVSSTRGIRLVDIEYHPPEPVRSA